MFFLGPGLKASRSGFLGPIAVLRRDVKPASKIRWGKKGYGVEMHMSYSWNLLNHFQEYCFLKFERWIKCRSLLELKSWTVYSGYGAKTRVYSQLELFNVGWWRWRFDGASSRHWRWRASVGSACEGLQKHIYHVGLGIKGGLAIPSFKSSLSQKYGFIVLLFACAGNGRGNAQTHRSSRALLAWWCWGCVAH